MDKFLGGVGHNMNNGYLQEMGARQAIVNLGATPEQIRKIINQDITKGESFRSTAVNAVDTEYYILFKDKNVDVIISAGQKFNAKKLKNIPDNVHIYKSVPQLEVLKIADVFVTHGGMNSVSEALIYESSISWSVCTIFHFSHHHL